VREKEPVQPEAVTAGLVAGHHAHRPAALLLRLRTLRHDQAKQPHGITTIDTVLADLVRDSAN
jgi:hypothetical protein